MKKLKDYGLDDQIGLDYAKKYFKLKASDISELKNTLGEDIANKIKSAVCGYMYINKPTSETSLGVIEQGWCGLFGIGLSCVLNMGSRWYHTSLVKDIDWNKHIFHTQNSEYHFKIDEYDAKEVLDYINNDQNYKLLENEN